MVITIDGWHRIEVIAETTAERWRGIVLDVDEETGARCVESIAEGDSRLAAMNWALANYFATVASRL